MTHSPYENLDFGLEKAPKLVRKRARRKRHVPNSFDCLVLPLVLVFPSRRTVSWHVLWRAVLARTAAHTTKRPKSGPQRGRHAYPFFGICRGSRLGLLFEPSRATRGCQNQGFRMEGVSLFVKSSSRRLGRVGVDFGCQNGSTNFVFFVAFSLLFGVPRFSRRGWLSEAPADTQRGPEEIQNCSGRHPKGSSEGLRSASGGSGTPGCHFARLRPTLLAKR